MIRDLSDYVKYLVESNIQEKEGLELINSDKNLTEDEKFLLEKYCYPKSLLDRELPSRVQKFLKEIKDLNLKEPNVKFASFFVEAYNTKQYGRFMRHLVHSFLDSGKVFPISGHDEEECALCGRKLYQNDLWQRFIEEYTKSNKEVPELENKEYLAFGSTDSNIVLCKDCIIQLATMKYLLENLESKIQKLQWNELKL